MSGQSGDGQEVRYQVQPVEMTVDCEYCGRSESFGKRLDVARAWYSAHIREEHSEELPPIENKQEGSDDE
jgi:hypothetical protein